MKRPVGMTAVAYHVMVTGDVDCCSRSSLTQMRLQTVVATMPMADTEMGNLRVGVGGRERGGCWGVRLEQGLFLRVPA
jgi:hypothetical protein